MPLQFSPSAPSLTRLSEVEVVDRATLECRYRGGEEAHPPFPRSHPSLGSGTAGDAPPATRTSSCSRESCSRTTSCCGSSRRELPRWLRGDARASVTLTALDGVWRGRDGLARAARGGVQRLPRSVRAPLLGLRDRIAARRLP